MTTKIKIPYVNIAGQHRAIKEELLVAIGKVIDHGNFILGDEVVEFERRFAELCGVPYAVSVNSGTDALMLALRVLEVSENDEVITVPNSFVTTASSIACVEARPVFVDVRDDYNIDPDLIEEKISSRTKAIMPVHLTGRPADMEPIKNIAKKHNLYLIEDCAQAVCAQYKGKPVGSFGDVGCFSLHPLKTLNACGDGGVLTTNDSTIADKLHILRNNGFINRNECVVWSSNSRLDTIQTAMLLVKLDYLDEWTNKRIENAHFYQEQLADCPQVKFPLDKPYEKAVYHTFVIQAEQRNELRAFLVECGIDTKIHYPIPIHLQQAAKNLGYKKGDMPVAEQQSESILSLPVYPELEEEEIKYITQCVCKFYES